MNTARYVAASALALTALGCSISGGLIAGSTTAPGDYTPVLGKRFDAFLQPFGRDSGVVLGSTSELAWSLGHAPYYAPDLWRSTVSVGYAKPPLPFAPRLGFETHFGFGLGRFALHGQGVPAMDGSVRLGMPIRLGPAHEFWDSEAPVALNLMLVPDLTVTSFVPLGPDVSHRPRSEVLFGLALRFHLWSTLQP
ncbi:MAG: hypothetical protein QM756_02380 [Polyangiaceae bacterium]